jgi:lambda family phage tail tape measure protein
MNDLATLGIAVDSSPAAKAAVDLDKMTDAAGRAEDAVVDLGNKSSTALKEVGKGASSLPGALKDVETSATSAGKATSGMVSPQLINQMNQFEASLRSGAKSTAELEIQRSQLRSLQKANMIDDAEAIKINQRLDKTQQEITKSALQEEKALDQLMRSIDPTAAKLAKLDRETEDLGRALDKGAIDAKDYSVAIGKIDESIAKLRGASDPIVQTTGAMGKLGLGTRQAREDVVQLGNALASGDWSGAARNIGQIGAEAGASAGRLAMIVAPIAVVVAAVAALAYGFVKGAGESTEFNKALELTGNFAGVSAGRLGEMAQQVSATVGTTGQAAEALTVLANKGKIASESFVSIAEAAVGMKEGTGKAVSDTIAEFVKLADEPVTASAALNEQYHYLTASVYAQITALELQGDHAGAVKLATEAYADAINERTPRILENLSLWEKGYNLVAKAADNLKNIGRRDIESEISQAQSDLDKANAGDIGLFQNKQVMIDYYDNKLNMLRDEKTANADIAKYQGEQDVLNEKSIVAMGKVDALTKSSWTNEQKRTEELKEYSRWLDDIRKKNPSDTRLNQATVDQNIANIKDKNKDSKAAAVALDLTAFNDAKNRIAAITAEYQNMEKEIDAAHTAGITSDQSYMEQKSAILQQQQVEVNAAYQAEIAALEAAKAKKGTSAAQGIQLDQKIADARANMVKTQQDSDSKLAVLATNEEGRLKKQTAVVENYIQALNDQLEQTKRQLQLQTAGVGMGDEARRRLQDDIKIQQDYQDKLDKLLAQRNKNAISQEVYDQETDAVRKALAERLQLQKDYYAAVEAEQSNWLNGATAAYQTYLEEARNVAGQTKSAFLSAFDSLEDVFVDFITTGKASFKDFANSVIADLARIVVKQQIIAPLLNAVFGSSGNGGGTTSFGGAVGSMLGGSGGSDSNGWGGMVGLGKNLYSVWSAVTGVGADIASGYASGGIGGAIQGGTGYYGNMLSSISSTLSNGFTSLASTITGTAAVQTAAIIGAEGVTSAAFTGAVSQGATAIGAQFTTGVATTTAATYAAAEAGAAATAASLGGQISAAVSSAAAMWPRVCKNALMHCRRCAPTVVS